jgi:hypothetical protein
MMCVVLQVLRQVHRALKPGGAYLFMEHVAASEGSTLRLVQNLISPFFKIVGNGCQFKELWRDINEANSMADMHLFDIQLRHVQAPIGLPPLAPHVIGKATKKFPAASSLSPQPSGGGAGGGIIGVVKEAVSVVAGVQGVVAL